MIKPLHFPIITLAFVFISVPAFTAPIKIMPLGNSITEGSDGMPTYRYFLWKNCKALGIDVDFVGTNRGVKDNGRPLFPDFDQDHEGHWGWRADSIQLYIGAWAKKTQPDIVIMHLGTNDYFTDKEYGTAAYVKNTLADYSAIIDSLRLANPRVTVFVGELIPAYYGAPIDSLNAKIPAFAQKKTTSTSKVIAADIHSSVIMAADGDYADGLHPNEKGQKKMADAWTLALVEYLKINVQPVIAPQCDTVIDSVSVTIASFSKKSIIRYTDNGTDPSATSPAYSAPLHFSGNKSVTIAARSFAPQSKAASAVTRATIHIIPDTTHPIITYVAASQLGRICLSYSKPVAIDINTCSPVNYLVSNGVRVDSVSISESGTSIVLYTSKLTPKTPYTVVVKNCTDRSLQKNPLLNAKSQEFIANASGPLNQEIWTNIPGEKVADITSNSCFLKNPNRVDTLHALSSQKVNLEGYASRIRCFLVPPTSGNYTFYVAADDAAELWLSTDSSMENKKLIASVPAWTGPRQWEKFPEQMSVPVRLAQNELYFCEVLHKEGIGGDHVSVAWKVPTGVVDVIDEVFLVPYKKQ